MRVISISTLFAIDYIMEWWKGNWFLTEVTMKRQSGSIDNDVHKERAVSVEKYIDFIINVWKNLSSGRCSILQENMWLRELYDSLER